MPAHRGSQDSCSGCLWPSAGYRRLTPLPETPGHSQASLAQSLLGSLLLPPGSWWVQGFALPSKSLFPWGFSVLFTRSPGCSQQPVVGPGTFATGWELLWYICSPVCGLSAWQLYAGAKGDLLKEDLGHTLRLPGLLQPEPLSHGRSLPTSTSAGDTQTQVWLSLLWGATVPLLWSWCTQGCVCALQASLAVWDLILNMAAPLLASCWGSPLPLGAGYLFLVGSNILLLMVVSCNFGVLAEEDERTSF